jgi:hypothetical protein
MARDVSAGVKEVARLLEEQYGQKLGDLNILTHDLIADDIANGEDPEAVVADVAELEGLTKLAPAEDNETRAFRIAMLGKRAEFNEGGNRVNPALDLGPAVSDDGEVIDTSIYKGRGYWDDDEDENEDDDDNDM